MVMIRNYLVLLKRWIKLMKFSSIFKLGNTFIQNITLSTGFANNTVEVVEIKNGYELTAKDDSVKISFTIDIDSDDFSVLYVKRKMNKKDSATDCFDLGMKLSFLFYVEFLN